MDTFWGDVAETMREFPAWRMGQAVWNQAIETWPLLVEPLRGTMVDPFFDNDRVPMFIDALYGKGIR